MNLPAATRIAARAQRIPGKMADRAVQRSRGGTERLAGTLHHLTGTYDQVASGIYGAVRDVANRRSHVAGYATSTASGVVATVGAAICTAGIATSVGHCFSI